MTENLLNHLTPEAKVAVMDDGKWSHDRCPENCGVCDKPLGEKGIPLQLWKNEGKSMISFHMKCAFGDKVTEPEDEEE